MLTAGGLEVYRLQQFAAGHLAGASVCSKDASIQAVDISVFYQVPQFVLVGISEILASVSALDFFYTQSPENLRSAVAAMNLLTAGLGQWITALLIPLVNSRKGVCLCVFAHRSISCFALVCSLLRGVVWVRSRVDRTRRK
jgi:peptide/histidine transporter 3/4